MEKALLQILEQNNRVILPEFGAFIVKQRTPLTIVFNEFLQYNDGLLIDHISKSEGCTRDEAKVKIEEFVHQINRELQSKQECPLRDLGILQKNAAGKITIEQGRMPASPASEVADVETTDKDWVTPPPSDTISLDTPAPISETPPSEAPVHNTAEVNASDTNTSQPASEPTQTLHETQQAAPKAVVPPTRSKEKRKKQNLLLWIMVIGVNAALVSYFVFTDQFKGLRLGETDDSEAFLEETIIAEPGSVTDPQPMEVLPEATPETQQPSPKNAGAKYYVVAGVFGEETNADKLVKELKANGYPAEKFGKIGNLYAVSYQCLTTKEEADQVLIKIQQTVNPEAWIRTQK